MVDAAIRRTHIFKKALFEDHASGFAFTSAGRSRQQQMLGADTLSIVSNDLGHVGIAEDQVLDRGGLMFLTKAHGFFLSIVEL